MAYVVDLGDESVSALAEVGGKALNLARLTRAGFRVPPGVVLSTDAYRAHVRGFGGPARIAGLLAGVAVDDQAALHRASEQIRELFGSVEVPVAVRLELGRALAGLDAELFAVRSSATAEDLPGLSFAGQQDSFLGVRGQDALWRAVRDCWASLWTARAIAYRSAHAVGGDDLALAVVVQRLITAEVSGVLFTADPVTGIRGHSVVDATFGLGEALVSGQVDHDHYLVDTASGRALEVRLGAKEVRIVPGAEQGVSTLPGSGVERTLSSAQIRRLAHLAVDVQTEFGCPQDVEWAIADGRLWVLQSRPITSLFAIPVPIGAQADPPSSPLSVWFSFGAFQGVLGPFTPLGRDAIAHLFAGAATLFGRSLHAKDVGVIGVAEERLWLRVDGVLRHPVGRRVLPAALGFIDPASQSVVRELLRDARLRSTHPDPAPLLSLARFLRRALPRAARTLIRPVHGRQVFDAAARRVVVEATERQRYADHVEDPDDRLRGRVWATRRSLRAGLRSLLPAFAPVMVPSLALLVSLRRFADRSGEAADITATLELLRALPGNVTTEMDLALWRVAEAIRAAGEADQLAALTPQDAAAAWAQGRLPRVTTDQLTRFLRRYGMRGVAEIDLGRPRWRENPVPVLTTLRSYLAMTDAEGTPDAVYRRAVVSAAEAAGTLTRLARRSRGGPLAASVVRGMTRRIRALFGARETPKFTIVQVLGVIRESLLASGADLVMQGWLERADDVVYLTLEELDDSAGRDQWRDLVRRRRDVDQREQRRRAIPRVICGDGQTFYAAPAGPVGAADLSGSPVSPGVVEAVVRVVHDPLTSALQPGEILVCAGTDPAWTPLFLTAAGLVTEVGGMMTHGSVVAREYGIPAVVGVAEATARLADGTRIRLDGSSGAITILS